jgi:hypothetical protein
VPAYGQDVRVLRVQVERVRRLRFDDGSPVRAASAVTALGDGWLVAQDDAAHGAWVRGAGVERVRLVPSVQGHDVFSSAAGTKHLKPDLEAACTLDDGSVLLLGSGSSPLRMRGVHVRLRDGTPEADVLDLSASYAEVARVLELAADDLNLEGVCRRGDGLRWFARGNLAAGVRSASVDVDLAALLTGGPRRARNPLRYDLGAVAGVGLTVTDAVALPDGRVLASAAAEDTPNAVDDGPVVASALALLDGPQVLDVVALPEVEGRVAKVEGLAVLSAGPAGARLLAVADEDDPEAASAVLVLEVRWV